MDFGKNKLTIKELRSLKGINEEVIPHENAPISVWYVNIQDIKLLDLNEGDIAKLIRQNLNLEYVIPEAIRRLNKEPTAGGIYVGELANSFTKVKLKFWAKDLDLCKESYEFFKSITTNPLLINFQWDLEGEKNDYYKDLGTIISNLEVIMNQP